MLRFLANHSDPTKIIRKTLSVTSSLSRWGYKHQPQHKKKLLRSHNPASVACNLPRKSPTSPWGHSVCSHLRPLSTQFHHAGQPMLPCCPPPRRCDAASKMARDVRQPGPGEFRSPRFHFMKEFAGLLFEGSIEIPFSESKCRNLNAISELSFQISRKQFSFNPKKGQILEGTSSSTASLGSFNSQQMSHPLVGCEKYC